MTRPLHVVQLFCGCSIGTHNGGAELFAINLARRFDPARVRVSLVGLWMYDTPTERRWLRTLAAEGHAPVLCAPWRGDIRVDTAVAIAGAARRLWGQPIDIVHTHTELADLAGVGLRLLGVRGKYLRTAHRLNEWDYAPHYREPAAIMFPLAYHHEAAVAPAIVEVMARMPLERLQRRQASYIPNGIDAPTVLGRRTGHQIRAELGLAPQTPLIGSVCRLDEQKGVEYFLRAIPRIHQEYPAAHVVLAGDGQLREPLQQLAVELGVDSYTHFLRGRSDAIDIIEQLDVFVLASLYEGLPTVILEAMLMGTPVIATDISGSRDLVHHEQTGLLVPVGDPEALAVATTRLLGDPALRAQLAERARVHSAPFDIGVIARQYEDLYLRMLAGRG